MARRTRIPQGCWVLVADSEKALFLRNDGDAQDLNLNVVRLERQDNPSDREQSANRPGRMQDTGVRQRSALDDTDWHELAKDRFADDLADTLYRCAQRQDFDRIVLVAAPGVLGQMRDKLHKEVTDRVLAEVPKTFTNHPLDQVERRLQAEFA